jgi:hypothetical protein
MDHYYHQSRQRIYRFGMSLYHMNDYTGQEMIIRQTYYYMIVFFICIHMMETVVTVNWNDLYI